MQYRAGVEQEVPPALVGEQTVFFKCLFLCHKSPDSGQRQ